MENSNKKPSRVVSWALILSIMIVLNLFVNYTITLFYEAPEYPMRHYDEKPLVVADTPEAVEESETRRIVDQEKWDKEYEAYEEARDSYEMNVFIVLIIAGVVIFALSLLFKTNYVLSTAFGLGALLDFIIASMRYWSSAESITRVVILVLALAVLIYIAYKKFGDKN